MCISRGISRPKIDQTHEEDLGILALVTTDPNGWAAALTAL